MSIMSNSNKGNNIIVKKPLIRIDGVIGWNQN